MSAMALVLVHVVVTDTWLMVTVLWLHFTQVLCGRSALPPRLYDCRAPLPSLQTGHHEGTGTSLAA